MIDAVLFDIDGTLVDSVDLHAECWHEAFLHFGKNVPFAKIRSQIGKGGDQFLPLFLTKEEQASMQVRLDKFRTELWKSRYMPQVRPFARVRELFERILDAGQKIALASSAKDDELQYYKQVANISDLVHGETSATDVERSKPYPDIFEAALDTLASIDRDRVMVVGDSPWDAIAAARAHLRTVGVLCGGFPARDLLAAGCVRLFQDPEDLLSHYPGSPIAFSADSPEMPGDLAPAVDEPQHPTQP